MSRFWKITLILSLLLNAILVAGAASFIAERGARAVAEDLGVVEPRRPDFAFIAEERFVGLPSAAAVLIGDSQIEDGPWSEVLERPVANRGLFGATISEIESTLRGAEPSEAHSVLIWAGTNDAVGGAGPEQIERDMRQLIAAVMSRMPRAEVFVLSLPPVEWNTESIPRSNQALESAADHEGARWVDVTGALQGKIAHDGLHISGEGYQAVGDLLGPMLPGAED
ncbi:GDSL-type esterase/lipase family protein [Micrococcus terreus]|uniref:GDSL-type esterase/lipase family protein n=1 Tax=Micrococcus terreus TaxID=574650 RepID=UPI00254A2433|nr:GDSL-type esterase/lipase family protein [Micrococcus terreus]MDK7701258.1 GDSL-type esterase/lipase family protein [Micrococcus terreus]WOO97735.1 GDSL-type esterase/lipase family protein [Micrococcus terreus]